jgi:hypothetical protein
MSERPPSGADLGEENLAARQPSVPPASDTRDVTAEVPVRPLPMATRQIRRSVHHVVFAAGVAATLGVAALGVRALVRSRTATIASAKASMAAATIDPRVATPADIGAAATAVLQTEQPPPAAAATAPNDETPSKTPFRRATASAALGAIAPELTDCRIPKGRSGKVEVVFEPDGHVASAKPLAAYVGTYGGKCVASHMKKARMAPFHGRATTYTYSFVIPD